MRRIPRAGGIGPRFSVLLVAAALALSAVPTVSAAAPAGSGGGHVVPAVGVSPDFVRTTKAPNAATFDCQNNAIDGSDPRCYTPDQIRRAYGIKPLLNRGLTGRGRTIVIIDAYSNPYIQSDLQIFDATFGIPDPVFTVVPMPGLPTFDINDDNQVGWSAEIALDVQWAHAIAPGAAITLVEAASNNDADILAATKYAVDHNLGDVISQSFGEAESCMDPGLLRAQHRLFQQATRKGITLFASSGDDGAAQPTCDGSSYLLSASTPASDPLVTAVGGTTLFADATTGAYQSERAWSDAYSGTANGGCYPPAAGGCSGGGLSTVYNRPDFQDSLRRQVGNHRAVPDVAYDAGVDGGVLVHWGVGLEAIYNMDPTDPTSFFIFGGTSSGSPQWAGLTAIADQLARHRLGAIDDDLYRIASFRRLYGAAFNDVTTGNNTFLYSLDGTTVLSVNGYKARNGWDLVTGLGTPNASALVPLLAVGGH